MSSQQHPSTSSAENGTKKEALPVEDLLNKLIHDFDKTSLQNSGKESGSGSCCDQAHQFYEMIDLLLHDDVFFNEFLPKHPDLRDQIFEIVYSLDKKE